MKRTLQDTIGWILIGVGLLALLLLAPGLAGAAGPAPLRVWFGWGGFLLAPALALGGVAVAFAGRMGWQVRWRAISAGEVLLLAALIVSHVDRSLGEALAGRGGGVVGWAFAQALTDLLGVSAARAAAWAVALAAAVFLCIALPSAWLGHLSLIVSAGEQRIRAGAMRLGRDRPRVDVPWDAHRVTFTAPRKVWTWLCERAAILRTRFGRVPAALVPDSVSVDSPVMRSPRALREKPAAAEPARSVSPVSSAAPAATRKRPRGETGGGVRPTWLPSLDLLRLDQGNGASGADVRQRAQLLKQTLAEFGVPVEVVSIKEGPTVTQFGLEPGEIVRELRNGEVLRRRVSVSSILRLNNDLALALAAPSLRIEAPVPGRPYVGIEVPNPAKTLVSLRNILEAKEFIKVGSPLTVALGRDVAGDPVVADLTKMPHLLIAGSTGSGKSVCINALICSLLMSNGPETVRLLMVDPKMVELPGYNGIPHLLGPVITDPGQAAGALAWLLLQMDDRYRTFSDAGVRNIVEYNRKQGRGRNAQPLPYLVLVIDELADLMMTAADDIEREVCRLAQMARATGIHLVLATQRPSVDVITGLIKANFPSRIAFAVTTQIDSRVILDTPGAEKLLGRGDMLYMAPDSAKLSRIQGCFVSDQEIERVVDFWKAHGAAAVEPTMPQVAPWAGMLEQAEEGRDELLEQALALVQTKTHISTSLLQRQLRLGYPRAARLMEQLEALGVVGKDEGGGRSREVLLRSELE